MSVVSENNAILFNSKPADNATQRATLARELRVARGFTLIFALCNTADERARQIAALKAELPDLNIQKVPVRRKIPHLLDVLRATLEDPLPDAVFVYGMENWLRGHSNPRSNPFVLNLNAARNHFSADCPCPLVFWIPEFLFRLMIGGAPDFVSVRSGLYVFSDSSAEIKEALQTLQTLGFTEASGLLLTEKRQRLEELKELLTHVRSLPKDQRNWQDEVSILNQLATMYDVMGHYAEAEPLYEEVLALQRQFLPPGHPDIAQSINDLALLYQSQSRYAEAEPLYKGVLRLLEQVLDPEHPAFATSLNNLAEFYRVQGRYEEAEPLHDEALALRRQSLPPGHPDIARSLNNLALLYKSQNRYDEAAPLYNEALAIWRQSLPPGHPDIATSLNNLAALYESQGRYNEAEPLYYEALKIYERTLGAEHPNTRIVRGNLETFHRQRLK